MGVAEKTSLSMGLSEKNVLQVDPLKNDGFPFVLHVKTQTNNP